MKKYSKYKASGIGWLGDIPEHWGNHRLDWIGVIVRGNTGFKKDELLNKGEYVALQYGKTYKVDEVNNEFNYYVNSDFYKESQIVSYGDIILISTSETLKDLGHSCFYNRTDIGLLGGEQILFIPNRKMTNEKYLYYYSKIFRRELKKYAKGLKVFRFNSNDLKKVFIGLPPLQEQTQIANYLDTQTQIIDKKVSLLKKKATFYKEYRKSLINQVVTKGLDKNVKLKDSGIDWIGQIPEHWEVKRFKNIGKTIKGRILPFFNIKFDKSLPNLSLDYLRNDKANFPVFCYSSNNSLKATLDDLIIVWDGAGVGEILKAKVGYISSTIAKLIFGNSFSSNYFYHLRYNLEYTLKEIPSGMGIPHLNPNVLNNYVLPFPPKKEQQAIANFLDKKTKNIDLIIKNIENQISTLQAYRKTLINKVVTGQIKITD